MGGTEVRASEGDVVGVEDVAGHLGWVFVACAGTDQVFWYFSWKRLWMGWRSIVTPGEVTSLTWDCFAQKFEYERFCKKTGELIRNRKREESDSYIINRRNHCYT